MRGLRDIILYVPYKATLKPKPWTKPRTNIYPASATALIS